MGTLAVARLRASGRLHRDAQESLTLLDDETGLALVDGQSAQGTVNRGKILSDVGRYEEAMQQFREAAPEVAPARYGLGLELFRAGRMGEAIEQLQAFITEESKHANTEFTPARMVMARAFARMERWPEAIEQCQRILAANPNDADAHDLLAMAFAGQRAFGAAIPHYRALSRPVRPTPATGPTSASRSSPRGKSRTRDCVSPCG
jgi:tetratricopeptide (TPR) repeat protein